MREREEKTKAELFKSAFPSWSLGTRKIAGDVVGSTLGFIRRVLGFDSHARHHFLCQDAHEHADSSASMLRGIHNPVRCRATRPAGSADNPPWPRFRELGFANKASHLWWAFTRGFVWRWRLGYWDWEAWRSAIRVAVIG